MSEVLGPKAVIKEVLRSRSGLTGIIILAALIVLSIIVVAMYPYDVVKVWNEPSAWQKYPRLAAPEWIEIFTGKKIPRNIELSEEDFVKSSPIYVGDLKIVTLEGRFYFSYDDFPSEITLFMNLRFFEKRPYITIWFVRPDGEEIEVFSGLAQSKGSWMLPVSASSEVRDNIANWLISKNISFKSITPHVVLFSNIDKVREDMYEVLKSDSYDPPIPYRVKIRALMYEEGDDIDVSLTVYGKVFGVAGTDDKRRDLLIGVLWGAPIALAFGLIASIATTVVQALAGALSAWYGGKTDEVVQRITDIYLVIPFLPILVTISFIHRLTIWNLLLVVILLSLFGTITKTARSMAFQIKEEMYVEAAISYGASKRRVLFLYIMPRVMPYVFANMVMTVPTYVFLEAALSLLGLGDPVLPTWGKLISEAYEAGALYHGIWWWILIPAGMVILTASAFALLGYAFDKILNPRLREQ
ncbi:MAG: ABC transporter permease [Candidatus Nezhaarchaeales archaeon]